MNIALAKQCVWVRIRCIVDIFFTARKIRFPFARGKYDAKKVKSANEEEIKGKDGNYRICIVVYMGL